MSIANKQENWNHSKIKDLEGEKKPTPTFCRLPPPPPFFNSLIAGEYCFKLKGTEKGGKRVNCVLVEANINWSAEPKKGKISKFPTVWHHSSYWCKTRFFASWVLWCGCQPNSCGTCWLRLGHCTGRSSLLPGGEDGKAQQPAGQAGGKNK